MTLEILQAHTFVHVEISTRMYMSDLYGAAGGQYLEGAFYQQLTGLMSLKSDAHWVRFDHKVLCNYLNTAC